MKAPWMQPAFDELLFGVQEIAGPQSNPKIDAYLATVGMGADDEAPWCSACVNWALKRVATDATGKRYSGRYHELPALLLNEMKKQRQVIALQSARLAQV